MLAPAQKILAVMIRLARTNEGAFWTWADMADMALSSSTGWANRALAQLWHMGYITRAIGYDQPVFILTSAGADFAGPQERA